MEWEKMIRIIEAQLLERGWSLRGQTWKRERHIKEREGNAGTRFSPDRPNFLLSGDDFIGFQHCHVFE